MTLVASSVAKRSPGLSACAIVFECPWRVRWARVPSNKPSSTSGSEQGVFWKRGLFRKVHFLEILDNLEILKKSPRLGAPETIRLTSPILTGIQRNGASGLSPKAAKARTCSNDRLDWLGYWYNKHACPARYHRYPPWHGTETECFGIEAQTAYPKPRPSQIAVTCQAVLDGVPPTGLQLLK